ncbi:MAG: tetratricopeptide repeat protein [Acidobacteria bacterium]|nr:tetratricopeptide repeat protein [Acidobacteriota bacterium]
MSAGGEGGGSRRLALAAVAIVAAAVAASTLQGGFVYDDLQNVVQNEWIRDPAHLPEVFTRHVAAFDPQNRTSFYRPGMHLIYMATYAAAGPRPWAFHLVNLAFHLGCAVLALLLASQLFTRWEGGRPGFPVHFAALAAALVFATHPVHAEPVAWIAGITDLSATCFVLLALVLYLDPRLSLPGRLAASASSYFVATLCKEPAFLLPLLLALVELFPAAGGTRLRPRAVALRLVPFGIAAVVSLGLRWHALGALAAATRPPDGTPPGLLPNALWLLAQYLAKLVAPSEPTVAYRFEPVRSLLDGRALGATAAVTVLLAVCWLFRKRAIVPVAIGFIVVPLLPALYLPALGEGVLAERYLYFPVFGLGLLAGLGLASIPAVPARWGLLALLMLASAAVSIRRQAVWRDNLTLWTEAVARSPDSALARESLCFAEIEARQFERAVDSCRQALALDPRRDDALINSGAALLELGRFPEALAAYQGAVIRRPASPEALTGLGLAQIALGSTAEAIASYRAAIAADPGYAEAHNCLGVAYARSGQLALAVESLQRAVREAPGQPEYAANLAAAERALGAR